MNTGEKIFSIRKLMKLSRKEMEVILGFPNRTLERIEKQENSISFDYIKALLNEFPEFIYWIVLDKTEVKIGQIDTDYYKIYNQYYGTMTAGYQTTGEEDFNIAYEVFNWKNEDHIRIIIDENDRLNQNHEEFLKMEEEALESNETDHDSFLKDWKNNRKHIHKM